MNITPIASKSQSLISTLPEEKEPETQVASHLTSIDCRDNAGNIHYEMANLSLLQQSVFYEFELLKHKEDLFVREAIKFDWRIKDISSEHNGSKIRRTLTSEEKCLNKLIKK
ncbi:hypothetical protein [Pantoea cypripedii]|uniref:Uncharacterized protein n=1 Tax=Pantoea cypripedii TaxID=55209 RepID=A0A1X1EG96_PANCY|nr:hypothetical protein [Pantoea cypripedii]MBP2199802.1 hypothetical protein [Pantoea cypripedii]ORM87931.1 hypothetical protein HA50_28760 [Pantoea cypripedii]